MKQGGISVQTEHIFPVIKKWLYSDKDIFVREVVSNACDAISKLKRLSSLGEYNSDSEEYKITVKPDKENRTITVSDNGIGMSEEELDKYINQIALSGALDFISKYEGENEGNQTGIIGHFGLGFYSSFMVSDTVELESKSYTDAGAVHWECDEAGSYQMKEGTRSTHGTDVIMHITESEVSYLDYAKLRRILEKYCSFMPVPIFFDDGEKSEQINEVKPLWQVAPADATDEQYKEFYKKVFSDYRDPLMYIHINADYPLNFKGILFFPAKRSEYENVEPEIKLFYNSVFVADNIKEILPDFLLNIKGVIDCPELPLNVSRSYLQSNTYVEKVTAHIVKKVADKLNSMFVNERESLEKIWDDIRPYMLFGCMKNNKFYERIKDSLMFKKVNCGYATINEYMGDKTEGTVYYATDADAQAYYISLYTEKGIDVLLLDTLMDTQYTSFSESKNEKIKFARIDSDLDAVNGDKNEDDEKLTELFKTAMGTENGQIEYKSLGEQTAPVLVVQSEQDRRYADMMRSMSMGMGKEFAEPPIVYTLIVNNDSALIKKLSAALTDGSHDAELCTKIAKQMYMLAVLSSRRLGAAELNEYVKASAELAAMLL